MTVNDAEKTRQRDARVVQQVLDGGTDMYRELVERYRTRVFTVALRLVANRADAEDLTQAAFVAAYRALGRFDPSRSFYTWLMRIAVNKCKDHLKSHKRREAHLTGDILGPGALFTGRVAGPEQEVEQKQRLAFMGQALAAMDKKYSVPLVLKEVQGMSYKQMQEVLGLPLTTLKIRVVRARVQLQERMSCLTEPT